MITSRRKVGFFSVPSGTSPDRPIRGHRLLVALVLGVSVCGLGGGCGDRDLPAGITKKAVAFSDVPSAVMSVSTFEST